MIRPNAFKTVAILLASLWLIIPSKIHGQYFGKNKPRYQEFDFKVVETPHFEFYHYLKDTAKLNTVAKWSEEWYKLHQAVLIDTLNFKNPFLLYNNHPEFQQTNAINSFVGVGTGGVTEAFKNRVILPFAFTNQQTNHVIGHELVHAFQYNMIINGDSTTLNSLSNLPLWMVEGLAEYLSVGKVDPHTAMWMRDAVLNNDIPGIKDLNSLKYFPYRWGQAFWSFITSMYGDDVIRPLFINTAQYGLDVTIDSMFKIKTDTLSNVWKRNLKKFYTPYIGNGDENFLGKEIISEENSGRMNVSPAVSPNGRYVIFLSEKNLFSTDLFLADARTGEILKKLTSTTRDGHLDAISFMESAGSWSPRSDQFVFVAYKKGRHILVIKEAQSGKTVKEIKVKGVRAISNPSWSPDGDKIAFTGMKEGQSDLYIYNLKNKSLEQLTKNEFSEIQVNWSTDGTRLVFATDELSYKSGRVNGKWTMNPAIINLEDGALTHLPCFEWSDNLNPVFDHENNILFISDRDGFRNLYKYELDSQRIYQLTDFVTGISGITKYSPAITAAKKRDRIIFNYYGEQAYSLYMAKSGDLLKKPVSMSEVSKEAASLPFNNQRVSDIVNKNLSLIDNITIVDTSSFKSKKYRPKFKLDHVFSSGVGVGISTGTFGTQTGLMGGVGLLFSDMLGNHQVYTTLALNGEIYDLGGSISYINRKKPVAWGVNVSHIPYRSGFFSAGFDSITINGQTGIAYIEQNDIFRIFEEQLSVFGQYPFSVTTRVEAGAGVNYRSFRYDQIQYYYDPVTGRYLGQNREKIELEDNVILGGLRLKRDFFYSMNAALVGDNSSFGMASPMNGYRYRLAIDQFVGGYQFTSGNIDLRYYHWLKPVSLAMRFQHFAQFGEDVQNFYPILIGNGQMGLIHGYDYNHLDENLQLYGLNFDQLSGSKFALASFEVRLPLTGFERLALIRSNFFFTELSVFLDAGVAFDDYDEFRLKEGDPNYGTKGAFVMSTGASLRINLFGALILEPYIAFPIRKGSRRVFGLNFIPGW